MKISIMKKFIYTLLIIGFPTVILAQAPPPSKAQEKPILLTGGTAHLGNGTVIENSVIGFDNGKITIVSESTESNNTEGYEVIQVDGKHIYPGFILPNSRVGLEEVGAVRAMLDRAEIGGFNPNVRSVISYNTDSEYIPTFRFNGVLLAETTPIGGFVSGTSSVMELEGWNWEDAVHTMDMGLHLNWPSLIRREFDSNTQVFNVKPNEGYDEQVAILDKHFADAAAYGEDNSASSNLKLAAMQGLFDGSKILFIHTLEAKGIIESVSFAKKYGVKEIVVLTRSAALKVSTFLKDNDIGVIIRTPHSLPERVDDDVYGPYKLPIQLYEAGLTVAISHAGMLNHSRNLPFYAGTASAFGLEKEEALKMITSNTAKLLGIDDRVGTLEVGKDATLFVSEGDALDFRTNILSHAFISGKQIILDSKQQELYERFSKKYGHTE